MENMRTDVRVKSVKEKKICTKETFHGTSLLSTKSSNVFSFHTLPTNQILPLRINTELKITNEGTQD